jgi:membrane dipeptidase
MEELGMIADVSHLSDAGFYDVLQYSSKPFVASHSNAREVCGCVRNLTDDMIRKLAERGGCMGLNFCADFLETVPEGQPNPGTIEAVVRHAKHIVKVGGIGVLGLGSDFDGIDTNQELPGAQSMELLWERLHQSGFTQGQLDAVFYKNVLRVYEEVL